MYSILDYGLMAADTVRMSAYARAIERLVVPGSVVLDLGSGTGIFALIAARAGARHVHAVDVDPAVWIARDLAGESGLADRITTYEASSFDVELPEKVDLIVSDMRGKTPLKADHLAAVQDARARFLKPGGTSIPTRDRLFVSAVEAPDLARDLEIAWQSCERLGFPAQAIRTSILNTVQDDRRRSLPASSMVTSSAVWAEIDYATIAESVVGEAVRLVATRTARAHGLAVWFEATVLEGSTASSTSPRSEPAIVYSTEPGQELAYARAFLPFLEPVDLEWGDVIDVLIRADTRGERWSWETKITSAAGREKARFRQATFLGLPTSPDSLLRSSLSVAPRLSERGARLRRLLDAMNGATSARELVDEAARHAPSEHARAQLVAEARRAIAEYGR